MGQYQVLEIFHLERTGTIERLFPVQREMTPAEVRHFPDVSDHAPDGVVAVGVSAGAIAAVTLRSMHAASSRASSFFIWELPPFISFGFFL